MRVGYETYLADFDDPDLLQGLPGDRCGCPHWGYLLSGRMTVRYADHKEIVRTGDVYYMAPGHTVAVDAGTVLIEFSPKDEFRKLTEIAERNFSKGVMGDASWRRRSGQHVCTARLCRRGPKESG